MRRGVIAVLLFAALLTGSVPQDAGAHAGLLRSDPDAGATLGDSPGAVRLAFTERPQASLSSIRVLDARGRAQQTGSPQPSSGDPLGLQVPVTRLATGVYTVDWRVVSSIDGHATSGLYRFGVGVTPTGATSRERTTSQTGSPLEVLARWALLCGLVLLLGGSVAAVARFGGTSGTDLLLAIGGWLLAALGLLLLAEAQRRTAHSSLTALLDTRVGDALIGRAAALAIAGASLIVARQVPGVRRPALGAAGLAAVAAIAVHVDAGHAASGSWPAGVTVTAQVAHVAAVGIWLGGLAALLLGIRGAPSAAKATSVRRFAVVAAVGLGVVVATGTLRALDELSSFGQLFSTGYGRAIVVKIGLIAIIAGLAARNRRLPTGDADLGPLRRRSTVELGVAAGALVAAALLGTLAPPVAGSPAAPPGLAASGSDPARTVRAELQAVSAQPGANRFVVRVADYRSSKPIRGAQLRLDFDPLDDPGVKPSSLALAPVRNGSYAGSGANLAFDGRWRVTAVVGRGGGTVDVPLDLNVRGPKQFISARRAPGQPPEYTAQVGKFGALGYIEISPHPERIGPSQLYVTCLDNIESNLAVEHLVVTAAAGDGPTQQQPVRRLGLGQYVAPVYLRAGRFTITVVARAQGGARLRSVFELKVPRL